MKHTPKLMTARVSSKKHSYPCIVDKYSGNRYRVVIGPDFLTGKEFQFNHGLSSRKKIDYHEIDNAFAYYYMNLYKYNLMDDQREYSKKFDELWSDPAFAQLAKEYSKYRGDLMTSDRECAAFMLALDLLYITHTVTTHTS